jgi:hypothetical protein
MRLELESGVLPGSVDVPAVEQALGQLAPDTDVTFAILTADNGDFIQTACHEQAFLLERQTSSPEHHFRGLRADLPAAEPKKRHWWSFFTEAVDPRTLFSRQQVVGAFSAFATGAADPAFLEWRNIDAEIWLPSR